MKRLIKNVTLATCILFAVSLLYSCGSSQQEARCSEAVSAVMEQFSESPIDTTVSHGEDVYADNFERLYNFSMKKIDSGTIAYAADGGKADEISIVRAVDNADVSEIKKYMEARLEKRLHDFENYKPEEVYKLENARVVVSKNYVFLVISDQAEEMITVIQGVLNQD